MGDYRQEAHLYRDGDMWCAVGPGFRNLAIDRAGFGTTRIEAVANLNGLVRSSKKRSVDDFKVGGFCSRCKEWVGEDETMEGCRDFHCPCQ